MPRRYLLSLTLAGLFTVVAAVCLGAPEPAVRLTDPRGDDHGDGNLLYPSLGFARGDLDLVGLTVTNVKDDAVFALEFANQIKQPGRGAADGLGTGFDRIARHGFYQFNVDIYIDTDRRPGSGQTRTLPGRLAVVSSEAAWETCVLIVPRPDVSLGQLRGQVDDADVLRRVHVADQFKVSGNTLRVTVPQQVLGGPAQATWAYVVVVTAADLLNTTDLGASVGMSEKVRGNLGALPISPGEWRERLGGGRKDEPLQPPIVDLLVPPGGKQEWVLADFSSRDRRPAELPGVVPAQAGSDAAAAANEPRWQSGGFAGKVFYEIFVRSFQDSNGDGIGDFAGIVERLDYLNDGNPATTTDLGVEGIWLMPVFASPSYHGYDCTDYYSLNPDYGTDEDFRRLIEACHARGIAVVLDLMVNHSSAQHPWFLESSRGPDSLRRDWYVWRTDDPGWTQPWGGSNPTWHELGGAYYYGIFWGGMPDLNFDNPAVRREFEAISEHWLARGVDGFRLDAARHITAAGPGQDQNDTPATHAYWREFSHFLRAKHPGALMLGEIWSDTETVAPYYGNGTALPGGDEFAMTFNFELAGGILAAVNLGDANAVASVLTRMSAAYPPGVLDATFLANHDMARLTTQFGGNLAKQGQAAAILLTLPGTPFLYYGEEVGLRNGPRSGDEDKRTPMPWESTPTVGFTTGTPWYAPAPGADLANVAAQFADPQSLLSRYRNLVQLRRASPALRRGILDVVPLDDAPRSLLAYLRREGNQRVLVVHNLSDTPATAAWKLTTPTKSYTLLFGDRGVGTPAQDAITLPARATGVWAVE
jgi:alpha-amylase